MDNYFPKGPSKGPALPRPPGDDTSVEESPQGKARKTTFEAFDPFGETPRASNRASLEDETPKINNLRDIPDETPKISNASGISGHSTSRIPSVPEINKKSSLEMALPNSRAPPRTRSRRSGRVSSGVSVGGNSTMSASSGRRTRKSSSNELNLSRRPTRHSSGRSSRRHISDDMSLPSTASAPVISSSSSGLRRTDISSRNMNSRLVEEIEEDEESIHSAPEPGQERKPKKSKTKKPLQSSDHDPMRHSSKDSPKSSLKKKKIKRSEVVGGATAAGVAAGVQASSKETIPDEETGIESAFKTPPSKKKKETKTPSTVSSTPNVKSKATEEGANVTIAHTFTQSGGAGRNAGRILGMSKPIAGIVAVLLMGTLGMGIFGWLEAFNLKEQIEELEYQIDRLEGEVDRLASEVDRLETENDRYEALNDQLNNTVAELQAVNDDLEETAAELDTSVKSLNATVIDLEGINEDLSTQNAEYQRLNGELVQIVSFLNETAGAINQSFEDLTRFLSEQIILNRQIAIRTLELQYQDQATFWDCTLTDIFQGESWVNNQNSPVGTVDISRVLTYVDERVLSELCLSRSDFNLFLVSRYGSLSTVSVNQLRQSVALYTGQALNYYFPDAGETGLTPVDWAEASYTCEGVADFILFP